MSRFSLNKAGLQRMKKYGGDSWKDRKGGISDDAWKGLSKKEKKKMQEAGLRMNRWGADPTLGDRGRKKHDEGVSRWEAAAWEMGLGNVKDSDQLKKLFKRYEDLDFKNFNSMNDAKAFSSTSQENIDKAIEDGIAARWDEFMKNNPGGGGGGAGGGDGTDPVVVDGAQDWNSRYMEVIEKFLDRMGGGAQPGYGSGGYASGGYGSAYSQGGHNMGWQPRGGW